MGRKNRKGTFVAKSALKNLDGGRADTKLVAEAIRKGWNIPPAVFDEAPEWARSIGKDVSKSDRDRLNAIKTLATMNGQNIDAEKGTPQTHVNVNVDVAVSQALVNASDDELRRIAGIGTPPTNGVAVSVGVLPASTNGSANGVSRNGHH